MALLLSQFDSRRYTRAPSAITSRIDFAGPNPGPEPGPEPFALVGTIMYNCISTLCCLIILHFHHLQQCPHVLRYLHIHLVPAGTWQQGAVADGMIVNGHLVPWAPVIARTVVLDSRVFEQRLGLGRIVALQYY